jgi:hypothetical protein
MAMDFALDLLEHLEWDAAGRRRIARATVSADLWPDVVALVEKRYHHPTVPIARIVSIDVLGITLEPDAEQSIEWRCFTHDGTEIDLPSAGSEYLKRP